MLDATPLSPDLAFGSMVRGLTLAQLDQQAVREALRALWLDRGVLVFRGGDASVDFQIERAAVTRGPRPAMKGRQQEGAGEGTAGETHGEVGQVHAGQAWTKCGRAQ